jgi:hypothetical protein
MQKPRSRLIVLGDDFMMEKFLDDAERWEQRHMDTWFGRQIGFVGGATSAQLELMSPAGVVGFTRDPTLFNLMKAAYGPSIAFGGYSYVSWVTGIKISLGERVMHSADMTRRAIHSVARPVGSIIVGTVRRTPGMIAAAMLLGAGHWLQSVYHDMSGMYIGDMRFSR